MSTTLAYPIEAEKIISALDKNFDFPQEYPAWVQKVHWICKNPLNIWPILASLSDEPDNLKIPRQNLRKIPLSLRYSETFIIRLNLDKSFVNRSLKALENYGINIFEIRKTSSGGVFVLDTGKELLPDLNNINDIINLLMRFYIDEPDDMCQSITSIEAEGPFADIKDFELDIVPEIGRVRADAAWIIITPDEIRENNQEVIKPANSELHSGIIPIILFDNENLSKFENEIQSSEFLNNLIKGFEKNLENLHVEVFPALLLSRTLNQEDTSYRNELFSLLWRTTNTIMFNSRMSNRVNSVTDFVLRKPVGLIELLRQKKNLEKLKSTPVIRLNFPDSSEFINLREKGVKKYSKELISVSETKPISDNMKTEEIIIENPAPVSPPVKIFDAFINSTRRLLDELVSGDFCKCEYKEFAGLSGTLDSNGMLWNQDEIVQFAEKIDSLFNNVGDRLDGIKNNLQSGLQNNKTRYASLITPSVQYSPEEIEKIEFFWKEFIPLSFKKLKHANVTDEMKKICSRYKEEFLNYIDLTPWYSDEFNKSISKSWPSPAQNINNFLNESIAIWELKINEELGKLDDFRKKNFPDEPKILTNIKLNLSGKPSIPFSLDIKIKKPGLLNVFVSQRDKTEWHSDTVITISNHISEIIKKYLNDVSKWFGVVENHVCLKLGEIEKMGMDSLMNINAGQENVKKAADEAVIVKREIEIIEKNLKKLAEHNKSYKLTKQKWVEIKSAIDK